MNFRIYYTKAFLISNWILIVLVSFFALASLSFVYMTVSNFNEYSLFQFAMWIILELFAIYMIFSTLYHGVIGLYPYVILKDNYMVVRVFSKPFHKIIRKLPYAELQLYSILQDSEEAQKRCSITKIGSIDAQHSVALRCADSIYIISVDNPLELRKELAYRMKTEL